MQIKKSLDTFQGFFKILTYLKKISSKLDYDALGNNHSILHWLSFENYFDNIFFKPLKKQIFKRLIGFSNLNP